MRVTIANDYCGGYLLRFFIRRWSKVAYMVIGLRGLELSIEFPSDWHEERRGWVRLGLGLVKFAVAFPWPWVSKDDGQCSGHQYGFTFFDDGLQLHWGKMHGTRDDPMTIITMPWGWRFIKHTKLSEPETHAYTYKLKSGEVQRRNATINAEQRTYWRPWIPCYRVSKSIDVEFDDEVGERTGSWKGGCTGCGYPMLEGDTPLTTLRRMEAERKF